MKASTARFALCLLAIGIPLAASAEDRRDAFIVLWERIEGITAPLVPSPTGALVPNVVGGVQPVGFPWSTTRGRARVDLSSGAIYFGVAGLSIGASPTPSATIGSTGIVTGVYASLVCRNPAPPFDAFVASTETVPLDPAGNAFFVGLIELHSYCQLNPTGVALLLRVGSQFPLPPTVPPIMGLWLAHGAGRNQ